jgi:NAD(P)H-hydrate epimerase
MLVSAETAASLDREASASWGLSPFALVEAAGRACAAALVSAGEAARGAGVLVCAGPGNNGADALVMLRSLLTGGNRSGIREAAVLVSRLPAGDERSPRSEALKALGAMGVPAAAWNGDGAPELFSRFPLIIDGIAGTGIRGPLEGIPLEMVRTLNEEKLRRGKACRVLSIDVPSGAGDAWEPGSPVVSADYTFAVEPLKRALYTPALRPRCGRIVPVTGIFPPALLDRYAVPERTAELLRWENVRTRIPAVPPDAYKYTRGAAEIHAGSPGFAGAARLAAAGASAAGAGLVRLVVDDELYPLAASGSGGTMVVPASKARGTEKRFSADALLLGPGWGRGGERQEVLDHGLEVEGRGIPLILDADGIALLAGQEGGRAGSLEGRGKTVFHRRVILTPHAGELEALTGIPKERLLAEPERIRETANRLNGVILFKSHVMIVAEPEGPGRGRIGFIDGMDGALGAGGSGDLLAGFCAAIAARMKAMERRGAVFDGYTAAAAAGTLLIEASRGMGGRFYDPLELASPAAAAAGRAWLEA